MQENLGPSSELEENDIRRDAAAQEIKNNLSDQPPLFPTFGLHTPWARRHIAPMSDPHTFSH